jgi:hypothetical protein
MRFSRFAATLLLAIPVFPLHALAAEAPAPALQIQADEAAGASIIHIKNTYSQPLAAVFIETLDSPDGSYSFTRDELGPGAIAPGTEKVIKVANPLPGASPNLTKVSAAIYEDGSTFGPPEKLKHVLDLRRARLSNTREIIQRIEADQKGGKDKDAIVADLRQWATTIVPPPPPDMQPITDPAKTVKRNMVVVAAGQVGRSGIEAELSSLKKTESELASSKPGL